MPTPISAVDVLDREFLDIRAVLLQLAASLDRIDRVDGPAASDPRIEQIHHALDLLQGQESNRAERIQLAFSLPYDSHWRARFGLHEPP